MKRLRPLIDGVFNFMEKEEWKKIPNFEDYEVSNIGRIKSYKCKKIKILKGNNSNGYLLFGLTNKSGTKSIYSHMAVAMAFLDHSLCGRELVIDHINGVKSDNRVENLQILSQRENIIKGTFRGKSKFVGVYWHELGRKWCSMICINGKKHYLGLFKSEEEAFKAYQFKLNELK